MPETVPNQRIVHIHRDMPQKGCKDFLAVKTENLYNAYRTLRSNRRGATAACILIKNSKHLNQIAKDTPETEESNRDDIEIDWDNIDVDWDNVDIDMKARDWSDLSDLDGL